MSTQPTLRNRSHEILQQLSEFGIGDLGWNPETAKVSAIGLGIGVGAHLLGHGLSKLKQSGAKEALKASGYQQHPYNKSIYVHPTTGRHIKVG